MDGGCRGLRLAVMAVVVLASSCGSSSGEDADAEAGPRDAVGAGVESLPRAEGRTAFAISAEAAIVGGGGTRNADGSYTASSEVWRLGPNGEPAALPPLPSEGVIEGLSGAQVGDTIVLGAMDCNPGVSSDFLACGAPRRPVLWTKGPNDGEWTEHPIPNEVMDDALWPDEAGTGGGEVLVFGVHAGRAFLSLTNGEITRFIAFDVRNQAFAVIGDGPDMPRGWTSVPYCLDEDGHVLQVRKHHLDSNPIGEAEDLSIARLSPGGEWKEGPLLRLGDVRRNLFIAGVDVDCSTGRGPIMAVSFVGGSSPGVLGVVDTTSLTFSTLDAATSRLEAAATEGRDMDAEGPEVASSEIVGVNGRGEVLVKVTGVVSSLVAIDEIERVSTVEGFEVSSPSTSPFVYGDRIGTIVNRTGEIHVE